MANAPQLENGYTRIANELLDAIISFKFTARQFKVVFAVIRKTYGYNKRVDDISLSQISSLCELPRNHVCKEISALTKMKVLLKEKGSFSNSIGLNKNYSEWVHLEGKKERSKSTLDRTDHNHYTYKITNIETGEFYIGVRSCLCLPTQDRYLGSGNWVSVQPKKVLKKEILSTHETREIAEYHEVVFIRENISNPLIKNRTAYSTSRKTESGLSTESVPSTPFVPITESVNQLGTESVNQLGTESVNQLGTESVTTINNPKDTTKDNSKRQLADAEKNASTDEFQLACKETWKSYSVAFEKRYGVLPVRNAQVNAQVKQFISRIGFKESPHVAAFYVASNEPFYVKKAHSVGLLLADAEKVRMQWATGRAVIDGAGGQSRMERIDRAAQEFLQGVGTNVIEGEYSHA